MPDLVTIAVIEEMAKFMLHCFELMMEKQEVLIIQHLKQNEYITKNQAGYLLKKLTDEKKLTLTGNKKSARYILAEGM